jgi:DNA-binding MurR/RpiR family transcriptional regulator
LILKDLIQQYFLNMSKGQKKVATFVLDNPKVIAVCSAQELGTMIGVSETTVIRFCYSLDFSGYAELQKKIRQQLFLKESSLTTYQKSKLQLEQGSILFKQVMNQDRQAIQETMNQINENDYETAIHQISKANTVYVLGLRSSYSAANWLSFTLGLVKENVRFMRPETEDVIQMISRMDSHSIVIIISFHRYLKETIQIAELAKKQNAFIIGITDSLLAPIHAHSNVLFPIYSPNKSTLDATTSLFSFMNSIVAGVTVSEKDSNEKKQVAYKSISSDFLFVEGGETN